MTSSGLLSVTILYCLVWDSPNLEGQVPVFISPRNRVALSHLRLPQPGGPGSRIYIPQEQGGPASSETSTIWRARFPYLYPAGTGWPCLIWDSPRNRVALSHLRLPQPGETGSRIYIPQEQGGPVSSEIPLTWKARFPYLYPPGTGWPCLIWDSPNLEGQVPVFISPRNRVALLYPIALGFLYVVSELLWQSAVHYRPCFVTNKR
jgi:hypothetical protein